MERITASLSIRFESLGSNSEIWIPATLVEMGLKAELGLGSQVSIWLGPPSNQSRMHDWAVALVGFCASAAQVLREAEAAKKPKRAYAQEISSPSHLLILRHFS
jgi:hypothetical protein